MAIGTLTPPALAATSQVRLVGAKAQPSDRERAKRVRGNADADSDRRECRRLVGLQENGFINILNINDLRCNSKLLLRKVNPLFEDILEGSP